MPLFPREAFKIFDRDGNGFIDMSELRHIITRLGDILSAEEADEFMREADLNGDGKLDYDEFLKYMRELEKDDELRHAQAKSDS
jgi:calmodulin